MIPLEQARQHLDTQGLKQAVEVLDSTLDAAASKQLTYSGMLAALLTLAVTARMEQYISTRTKPTHLPFQRTLEQFDFSFQPSIDERQVRELASMAIVDEGANLLLLGPPGWARPIWPWLWPSRPSRRVKGPTSSVPTT